MKEKLITRDDLYLHSGRTWVEIDVEQLIKNYRTIKTSLKDETQIIVVLKANGYGHGSVEIAKTLSELDDAPSGFAVASLDEGLQLRENGINKDILLFSFNELERSAEAINADLTLTVASENFGAKVNQTASDLGKTAKVHLKLDTGMSRLGFNAFDDGVVDKMLDISKLENLDITGMYTHFATADGEDYSTGRDVHKLADEYFEMQLDKYLEVVSKLEERGLHIGLKHTANSGTIIAHKEAQMDAVRVGILVYGAYPSDNGYMAEIKPIMSWKTRVMQVKKIKAGTSVSYNRQYVAAKDMTIAVLPVGYADGYNRQMSGHAYVNYKGINCPVIGMVNMDIIMIDCSEVDSAAEGDEVYLMLDHEGTDVNVYHHSKWQGTIPYEIYTSIAQRVPRIYKRGKEIYKAVWL